MDSLVVEPGVAYEQLERRLRALGWSWLREAQSPPMVIGEPEYVLWESEDEEGLLVYTFNPVMFLRVLQFRGPSAAKQRSRVASFLPHLTAEGVSALLQSGDLEGALLGLFAARELELFSLLPWVYELTRAGDELLVKFALDVQASLENLLLVRARSLAEQTLRGDFAAVAAGAPILESATLRRQVLRTAAKTLGPEQTLGLHFLLRRGLVDPDWEVRATAAILAARCGMVDAAPLLADVDFSALAPRELESADAERLNVLGRVCHGLLAGNLAETTASTEAHARRLIVSGQDGQFDALFLLVHALTTPLSLQPRSEALPPCIVASEHGFVLARSGLEMVRVSCAEAWLGDDAAEVRSLNPLRRVTPRMTFFIARTPLSWQQLELLGQSPVGLAPRAEGPAAALVTYQDAERAVKRLAELEGTRLALPGSDQWELAVRGNDARRYPWGNSKLPSGAVLSPFGLALLDQGVSEWVRSGDELLAAGGPSHACSQRMNPLPGARCAVRPIVLVS